MNGQSFQAFDETSVLREAGEHCIQVRGVGADGEVGPMAEVSVTVDAQEPQTDIHIGRPTETESGDQQIAITITAIDDNGVKRIDTSLNGGEFTTYDGPFQLSASRTYVLAIRAVDIVDNVSPTRILKIESIHP